MLIQVSVYYVQINFQPRIPYFNLAAFLTLMFSITAASLFFSAMLFRVGMIHRKELTPAI